MSVLTCGANTRYSPAGSASSCWAPGRSGYSPRWSGTTPAQYLIAIAENDDKAQPEAKDALREAFAAAGRTAEIEVYEGTLHGWCPPDSRVYDEPQAERAWSRLLVLLGGALA